MATISGSPQEPPIDGVRAQPAKSHYQSVGLVKSQAVNQNLKHIADYAQLQEKLRETPLENVSARKEITDQILAIVQRDPVLREHFEKVRNEAPQTVQVFAYQQLPGDPGQEQIVYTQLPSAPASTLKYTSLPPEASGLKEPSHIHVSTPKVGALLEYKAIQADLKEATLTMYLMAYGRLEAGENPGLVRSELYADLNALRSEANEKLAEKFDEIKKDAASLAHAFNHATGSEKQNAKANIEFFNRNIAELNVGNSSTQALHFQMTAFEAVFERRCLGEANSKSEKLPQPNLEEMHKIAQRLGEELKQPNRILSDSQVKKEFALSDALKWGQEKTSVNHALSNPINWTNKLGAVIQMSKSGNAYVAATEISPLGISDAGGVPSGLRGKEGYVLRPVNLQHTKTYLLGDDGKPISGTVHESFRGGVFPSAESAKEAVRLMSEKLGRPLTSLHVNALLTPVRGLLSLFKKDYKLLKDHKENMKAALGEAGYLSNFGVNEGAVGKAKIGPITLPAMAWHTSIAFTNEAAGRISNAIQAKIALARNNPVLLDRLVAIVQLGQDMQAVWANNDFARGDVGNNQFKLPAMWKAMDALLDMDNYLDCMSGKDRTSEVAANAQSMLDEIHMNINDRKVQIRQKLEERVEGFSTLSPAEVEAYGVAILNDSDIERLREITTPEGRKAEFAQIIDDKKVEAQIALGATAGFMNTKQTVGKGALPKMVGIQRQEVLAERPLSPVLAAAGAFTPTSPYDKGENKGAERQREAVNRRLEIQAATIGVTQQNTGVMGMKVKLTQAVILGTCGFDIGFVNEALKNARPESRADILFEHAGLNEIDEESKKAFLEELKANINQDFSKLLQKIAKRKALSFKPPIHVSG